MDAETRELARGSFRRQLAETSPERLIADLRDSGWHELCAEDRETAISLLFEEQGRSLAATPALDGVALAAIGDQLDPDVAVLYPTLSAGGGSAGRLTAAMSVRVDAIALRGIERAKRLRFAVKLPDAQSAMVTLSVEVKGLRRAALGGLDRELGLVSVSGELSQGSFDLEADAGRWARAVDWTRLALAHELVGVAERATDQAVEHVKLRKQFDRPIGAFQAVKHRLAEVHVAMQSTRTALAAAWRTDDSFLAAIAKTQAGRAAHLAARHCMQVCGGMGFSWEFGMHRIVRRALLLDSILGRSQALQIEIGERLIEERFVPRLEDL